MDGANVADAALRFGDWGPGYLLEGPRTLVGVCHLRPGDVFDNHYHAHHEEMFIVLEGTVTLWMHCQDKHVLRAGDVHRCDPLEMHFLSNDSEDQVQFLFVKAPAVPGDRIDVPWRPGQPAPERFATAKEK